MCSFQRMDGARGCKRKQPIKSCRKDNLSCVDRNDEAHLSRQKSVEVKVGFFLGFRYT